MVRQKTVEETRKKNKKMNTSGGSAMAGGLNFQAAVSAIVSIHVARGSNLKWLDGIVNDIPIEWSSETGGAGDDIQVRFKDKSIAEIQVKKGLKADNRLWGSLIELAKAISNQDISYGVLVVCPKSSAPVSNDLAKDIPRLGDGRTDNLKVHAKTLQGKLQELGLPIELVCSRLRIITVHALEHDSSDVNAACSGLEHLCADKSQIQSAWDRLYLDAETLIIRKGRRTPGRIMRVFNISGITLKTDSKAPIAIIKKLTQWTLRTYDVFQIFGIDKPFTLDKAWIPLRSIVEVEQTPDDEKLENLVKAYHSWDERESSRDDKELNPETIGHYFKYCVLVAGPGMGKSTLLKKLARVYSQDNLPVLFIRLPRLVNRINSGGSFEEGIFMLGLDGSGISFLDVKHSGIQGWVILLDGLDECGNHQDVVCEGLKKFVIGYPNIRVIVTTRPIGYSSSLLKEGWRHYELLPLNVSDAINHVGTLLRDIYPPESNKLKKALEIASIQLKNKEISHIVSRSPFLLGLATLLFLRGKSLGKTKTELYENLFELIDEIKLDRVEPSNIAPSTLVAFLNIIAWDLQLNPIDNLKLIKKRCADELSKELGEPNLKACQIVDACLKYWEQVGMLEQLHFEGNTTIVFIHKTFSEYAAARYLVGFPVDKHHQLIKERLSNKPATEDIVFAASLGAVDIIFIEIIKIFEENRGDSQLLVQALSLLHVSEKMPNREIITSFLDIVFKHIELPTKQFDINVADAVLPICKLFPDEILIRADKLLEDEQPWTRLAAWAFFVTVDKERTYTLDKLLVIFREIPEIVKTQIDTYSKKNLTLLTRLRLRPKNKLAERLVVFAIGEIIQECPEQADSIIDEVLSQRFNDTVSFNNEVFNILSLNGKKEMAKSFRDPYLEASNGWLGKDWIEKYKQAEKKANIKILPCLNFSTDNQTLEKLDRTVLFYLSAFLCASSYNELHAHSDWIAPFDNEVVREVFKGMLGVTDIDSDGFYQDIQFALKNIREGESSLYNMTTQIDIEPDWEKAKYLSLDAKKIEKALYHHSDWVVNIAMNLLINIVNNTELVNIIEQILDKGKYAALWAGAQFSKEIDRVDLIFDRLLKPFNPECQYQYLFQVLKDESLTLDENLLNIIENGLMNAGPLTAIEAAEIAEQVANSKAKKLETILIVAFKHWQKHEKPYPEENGVVPDSPRDKILKALYID
ncbi:MAG: hypothetical protein GQ475_03275 [Methylococcaceae bacterium]|nr:hypothetical protein [Methylococcaceae bacterium]